MGVSLSKSILTSSPSVRVKWLTTCVTNYITGNPICQGEKRAGDIFFRPVDFFGAARVRGGKGGGWFSQRDFHPRRRLLGKKRERDSRRGDVFLNGKRANHNRGQSGGVFKEDTPGAGYPGRLIYRPLGDVSRRSAISRFLDPWGQGGRRLWPNGSACYEKGRRCICRAVATRYLSSGWAIVFQPLMWYIAGDEYV